MTGCKFRAQNSTIKHLGFHDVQISIFAMDNIATARTTRIAHSINSGDGFGRGRCGRRTQHEIPFTICKRFFYGRRLVSLTHNGRGAAKCCQASASSLSSSPSLSSQRRRHRDQHQHQHQYDNTNYSDRRQQQQQQHQHHHSTSSARHDNDKREPSSKNATRTTTFQQQL